ncbi:hypothetical protein [Hyphomonas pacifica]|uniref:ASCH domain-containing protein n=1 Tax=Hyphomonas pacifica TaxID=1280941 RepID=A0A8B2PLK4_9PROT|nr:hypothetical protein [Hyphomonas pacifica]RAN30653.1 hypothetical protein HY3_05745 [Hyphomonas pacifica]
MGERKYHALEFEPRAREAWKRDPERRWALSVKQPLAGMVIMGRTPLVSFSKAPPAEMIGKRIALHAGAGEIPYKQFQADAREWVEKTFGADLPALRHLLPYGGVLGTVVLEAAFRIGRVMGGQAWADPKSQYAAHYAGTWHQHDGKRIVEIDTMAGRWAWALTEPRLCRDFVPLRGHGGIFDLQAARDLHRQKEINDGQAGGQAA